MDLRASLREIGELGGFVFHDREISSDQFFLHDVAAAFQGAMLPNLVDTVIVSSIFRIRIEECKPKPSTPYIAKLSENENHDQLRTNNEQGKSWLDRFK